MRPDKASLFQQLVLPYRTNPNVFIESHDADLTMQLVNLQPHDVVTVFINIIKIAHYYDNVIIFLVT